MSLLPRAQAALEQAAVPPSDERWALLWTQQARLHRAAGEHRKAAEIASRVLEKDGFSPWEGVRWDAMRIRAEVQLEQGELDRAAQTYRELAQRAETPKATGQALLGQAEVARKHGAFHDARERLSEALTALQRSGDTEDEVAEAWRLIGRCEEARSDTEAAELAYRFALEQFERLGLGPGAADCEDRLARLAQERGALQEAAAGFTSALSRYEATANPKAFGVRMRLAVLRALQGEASVLWPLIDKARVVAVRLDHPSQVACGHGFSLVRHAIDHQWTEWDTAFLTLARSLPRQGAAPVVVAWLAEVAGLLARRAHQDERAGRALSASMAIWSQMGRVDRAAEVQGSLAWRP